MISDSAYVLDSFIITLFDSPNSKTPEDTFNFYHSSARIAVECAFVEIDLRWEIFWKRLKCSMKNAVIIIEGALHLHTYLVNYREERFDPFYLHLDTAIYQPSLKDCGINYIVVGNDYDIPGGRSNIDDAYNRTKGLRLRDTFKCSLPRKKEWEKNDHMHVIRT